MTIDWVVFDLGDVVLAGTASYGPLGRRLAERLGVSAERLIEPYFALRHEYDSGCDPAHFWITVAERAGAASPPQNIDELVAMDNDGWNQPRPDTLDLIGDLHAAGVGLAVCSNAPSSMGRLVETQPWAKPFQHFVFSGDLGICKPDPAIYAAVDNATGAQPERTVFLDDKYPNVEGAQAAGWKAFTFTHATQARIDLRSVGLAV